MLSRPSTKYQPFPPIALKDRTWPDRVITSPPIWMSTDLRDGNQALMEPMGMEKKLAMFGMLTEIGFREIEVGFPSASAVDFGFVRKLILENRIPEEVTIEVLTPSREELIERTLESVKGAKRVIVHLYNATSPLFRNVVFGLDRKGTIELALRGTRQIRAHADLHPETEWIFQYSPETFSATELEFSKEICDAVAQAWGPSRMIVNLPATVEMGTPNIFADQVEWMHRHLARRDSIVLSVHPHNDRGCAVAAAELALMAGADRIEGCLFGNGERTGNVDLITLALNLYTQGIDPGLDFSDIDLVRQRYEDCCRLPVHPRHPYAGDLVFTAFSGSHQDAIRKGLAQRREGDLWEIPYLPLDPADLGRSYGAIIRVNSQSGKGGMAYLLQQAAGLDLPRRLQIEFSQIVQREMDQSGREVSPAELHEIFSREYLECAEMRYLDHHVEEVGSGEVEIVAEIQVSGNMKRISGHGNGPIDAFVDALGLDIVILDYHEHSVGSGANAQAAAYVEMRVEGGATLHGVGIDANIVTASLRAILSGASRSARLHLAEVCAAS